MPKRSIKPELAPPVAVVNEIVERGFVMSPDEYELISNAITVAAHAAAESGRPAVYQRLRMLLGRMSQSVQAPGGLKPEQIERFRRRAAEGLRERDSAKLAGGVQDLIAATCRTDPDPGDKVALYLLQLVADVTREHGNIGVAVLARLDLELAGAQKAWEDGKWPPAAEVLGWIRETIAVGVEDLQADREPWATDGESDPDEPDDQNEADQGDDEDESDEDPVLDA